MRATISVEEKRGFFSTSWTVRCHVEFSHVEQTVIRQANLGDRAIYQDMGEEVTLRQFIGRGSKLSWDFPTTLGAQKNKLFLENDMLPMIKAWIEAAGHFFAGTSVREY